MRKTTILLLISIILICIDSCKRKNARLQIDVSGIGADIKIKRYENDLFSIKPEVFKHEIVKFEEKYPFFLEGISKDTLGINSLYSFISDPFIIQLYADCRKAYPDLTFLETELTNAMKHLKYYYPDIIIPEVYTYVSGLEYQYPIKYSNHVLVISLDMYLGNNYKAYKDLRLPAYKTYKFRKESIVPDCMKEIAGNYLPEKTDNTFLSHMIEEGKIIYFTEAMMPGIHDSLKIDYTSKQLDWCKKNEAKVWAYFIDQNLLYNNHKMIISKFISDAPYTTAFSNQSPPRIAVWVGWQIIRNYMDRHPEVTLKSLMSDADAQKILIKSKYKPKK